MAIDPALERHEPVLVEASFRELGDHARPWFRLPESLPAALFLVLAYASYLYAYARSPIFAGDTDVWYHLNSGRYFWTHLKPPTDNFFSFLRPVRPWTDYFWLFQAFIYKIYEFAGYYGLVAYRLITFLAAETAVLLIFLRGARESRTRLLWPTTFFFLFGLVLSSRYFLVRPHTLSYLFLAIFLLILERGRRWSFLLPPLAVIWANVHGITYPVLFLVCLSYLGELAWRRLREGELPPSDLRLAAILTLCLFAVYATPHGSDLIRVPFVSTRYAAQYINELAPVEWKGFLSGEVVHLAPSSRTAFHLIVVATLGCAALGAFRQRLAPRHLLLLLGAGFLLTKGARMACEFSLLSAPLLAIGPGNLPRPVSFMDRRTFRLGAFALMVFAQLVVVRGLGWTSWKFPFSPRNLPVGVTHFLQTVAPGGRVLNDHNSAGYVQWALYPRYSIFMDMEVPYLFTDEDMFLTVNAYKSAGVFEKICTTYRPDFVSVPVGNKDFPEIAKRSVYRPIFFDDAEVLYVDAQRHPALANRYGVRELKPHELAGESLEDLLENWDEAEALRELHRIRDVYPDCGTVNQVLAMIALRQKNFREAERCADRLIGAFPEAPQGYKLKGDALQRRGSLRQALAEYEKALIRADPGLARKIYVEIGQCYRGLSKYPAAYKAFSKGVAVYSPATTFKELYYLASAAYLTGRFSEAEMLYRFALAKVPPSETEWGTRLENHVALFDSGRVRVGEAVTLH